MSVENLEERATAAGWIDPPRARVPARQDRHVSSPPRYVDQRIERTYRVRFDEAGPDGNLRSGGYLRFAQDLAWIHSESAGFGREWYGERGLFWLVRGVELEILEATWSTAPSWSCRRRSSATGGSSPAAGARSAASAPSGSSRLRSPIGCCSTTPVARCARRRRSPRRSARLGDFTPMRVRPGAAPDDANTRNFVVRRSETDPMAHVNNAGYVDYLDEQYLGLYERADRSPAAVATPLPGRVLLAPQRPARA